MTTIDRLTTLISLITPLLSSLLRFSKLLLSPTLSLLAILLNVIKPVTLVLYFITQAILIPLSLINRVIGALYPVYLFLGSSAIIGLTLGLVLSLISKGIGSVLPSDYEVVKYEPLEVKKKRRVPTRNIMSSGGSITGSVSGSVTSLKTPTIKEESDDEDYITYKPSFENLRRRRIQGL